jgi:hypothetical protein
LFHILIGQKKGLEPTYKATEPEYDKDEILGILSEDLKSAVACNTVSLKK